MPFQSDVKFQILRYKVSLRQYSPNKVEFVCWDMASGLLLLHIYYNESQSYTLLQSHLRLSGLIKGYAPGKFTSCGNDLPNWSENLKESSCSWHYK